MSKNTAPSESAALDETTLTHSRLSTDALARRRMLLKSLGKGSTVIAAAVIPMHTLATTVTTTGKLCTVSGTMSGVHSQVTNKIICTGKSPGYYHIYSHWPNYNVVSQTATNNVGNITFTGASSFASVFGSGSSSGMLYIMNNDQNTEYFHWIAALLNAISSSQAQNFPYTAQQVIDLFKSAEPMHTNALNFFKNYLEQ